MPAQPCWLENTGWNADDAAWPSQNTISRENIEADADHVLTLNVN